MRIRLTREDGGGCRVSAQGKDFTCAHNTDAASVTAALEAAWNLLDGHEQPAMPLVDPVAVSNLGWQLANTFLEPLYAAESPLSETGGNLLFSSHDQDLLNLPWEFLPATGNTLLVEDARWSIRRFTQERLTPCTLPLVARPLRILFTACAPTDLDGLDFEKEEEAMLHIANRLGGQVHLEIAEAGTFDELKQLITEYDPHVVHLSGHGIMRDDIGHFAFENERGRADSRDAHEMATGLFAGRGVRLVFVSGCQSARAGTAGVCQRLTEERHVPTALGWAASIGDGHATEFARVFYHELAAGRTVDAAMGVARVALLDRCRHRQGNVDLLDTSFALPQLYAGETLDALVDEQHAPQPPSRPGVRYELLGDNIRGLREGFVGRRRLLQSTRPPLRDGEKHVLFLTGIGGAGKSTVATRLANRFKADGYRVAALQAREEEPTSFGFRIVTEIATACQRLGRDRDEAMLRDGERPLSDRLRLAVEVLNDAPILLVLDNLETVMEKPPAPPAWSDPEFAAFIADLCGRLTGEGRAILTCRYLPEGWNADALNVLHEGLPDFTEASFLKYLRRHPKVAPRLESGDLDTGLISLFHEKLGATPRFIEQACAILAEIDPDTLHEQLEALGEPAPDLDDAQLLDLRQAYFADIFLPQLYDALAPEHRTALSRVAVTAVPLPLDGIAMVAGLDELAAEEALRQWLTRALIQRFGEADETPLFAVYPLQRSFLTAEAHLDDTARTEAHRAAAAFLQAAFEEDREDELRLHFMEELLACRYHAEQGGDNRGLRWAVGRLATILQRQSEYKGVLAAILPILEQDRHPELLRIAGDALPPLGMWSKARACYEEALLEYEAHGDRKGEATTLHNLAAISLQEGKLTQARKGFQESLSISQIIRDRKGEATSLHCLASIDLDEGDLVQARAGFEKALEMRQDIGDRTGQAASWHQLATIDLREGSYDQAREGFQEALEIVRSLGDRAAAAAAVHQLATIDTHQGKNSRALEGFKEALGIRQTIGDRAGEASTWHNIASIEFREGHHALAGRSFQKALEILQTIGALAGEASTLAQIAMMAWNYSLHDHALRLAAIGYQRLASIGVSGREVAVNNLAGMATDIGLDQKGLECLLHEAAEQYRNDRGASLVQAVFEAFEAGSAD